MLEVTEPTLHYLLRTLQARHAPEDIAMRLSRKSGSLEVFPDREHPGDRTFDVEGRTVLVVTKQLLDSLDGRRLGVLEGSAGAVQLFLESA